MGVQAPGVPLQKAVRVTTIMKRLRAPEQSDSRANSPTAGAAAPPAPAADPPCPPEGETPAGEEISQAPPGAAAPASEPPQLSPAAQEEAEAEPRCNGGSSTATETGKEQG